MKAVTEEANPKTRDIDRRSTIEIIKLISHEDKTVAEAVSGVLERVAQAVDLIVERLRSGGRLIYVGTGTSGRLGVLDASEIPPTFGASADVVIGIIAGGFDALRRSAEAAEDDPEQAARDLQSHKAAAADVVVGISASGNTPYTLGAVEYAKKAGIATVAVTCNPDSQMAAVVDVSIAPVVGPEVLAGSSRMKAGTAQKMILNMLSTATMIKLGWVYSNLMSNLRATNAKLRRRACGVLAEETGISDEEAVRTFEAAGEDLRIALLMTRASLSHEDAQRLLDSHKGSVRSALDSTLGAVDSPS